jgi:hypothetical protein
MTARFLTGMQQQEKKPEINVGEINNTWEDSEDTAFLWKLISTKAIYDLKAWLEAEPQKAFIFVPRMVEPPCSGVSKCVAKRQGSFFMEAGVPKTDRDSKRITPVGLLECGK